MAGKEEMRVFVGGLSWNTSDRQLEDSFSRYGKILEAQIMLERETGRPQGFGFVTFADQRAMVNAIKEMHGRELGGRVISVNRAQSKLGVDDSSYGYGGLLEMSGKDEMCIFVGGLSWNTMDRQLEDAFGRYGKILEVQIMLDRDTGRPRGFGFVTFADQRAMENAIKEMHGRELGGRVISVNRAQPKLGGDDSGYGYGGFPSGGRGSYGGGDRSAGRTDCFKCGRPGHWARECPSAGGGGGRFSSHSRFRGGGGGGRGDRFGDRYGARYMDDRYDGGRYGDRDRVDNRDMYGGRDRYASERYPPGGARFPSDRYGTPDWYPPGGSSGKDRGYDREVGPRGGGDRYGSGGPVRYVCFILDL